MLTGLTAFWFEQTEQHRARTTWSRTRTCPRRCAAAAMLVERLEMVPGGVRGARLHHGLGLEGLPGHRRGLRDRAAGGLQRVRAAARADLHAGHQGRAWATTTRTWTSTAPPRSWATARCSRSCGGSRSTIYELGAAPRARARDHPGRHQVRVRPPRPTARSCWATRCSRRTRRASGRPTATSRAAGSRASTSSSCATGPPGSGWDKSPPAPAAPRRGRRGHARALRGGLRAHHRRAVRRLARALRAA